MKVSHCKKCEYCERRVWSHTYYPNNYHPIGMSHAYMYCKRYDIRVSKVKKCKYNDEREGGQ